MRRKGTLWWCWVCDAKVEDSYERARERQARVRERAYGTPERMEWLHGLPCVGYGCPGHVCGPWDMDRGRPHIQAVHVRARGAGGTADDVVPGCYVLHQEAGEFGTSQRREFEARTGLNLVAEAARLAEAWRGVADGADAC